MKTAGGGISLYTVQNPLYQLNGELEASGLGTRLPFEATGDPSSQENFVRRTPGEAGGCGRAARPRSVATAGGKGWGRMGSGEREGTGERGSAGTAPGQLQDDPAPLEPRGVGTGRARNPLCQRPGRLARGGLLLKPSGGLQEGAGGERPHERPRAASPRPALARSLCPHGGVGSPPTPPAPQIPAVPLQGHPSASLACAPGGSFCLITPSGTADPTGASSQPALWERRVCKRSSRRALRRTPSRRSPRGSQLWFGPHGPDADQQPPAAASIPQVWAPRAPRRGQA